MNKFIRSVRYDLPLHFVLLLTNWLPDNVIFLRLRGALARPFIGKCGVDFRIGRNVAIHNPQNLNVGNNVYIAYGCSFITNDKIIIQDEVIFGPYCVVSSGNHTSRNSSFRYGPLDLAPIIISKGSWIAAHVVVTAGTKIGENCLVAAGAVVTSDIPSGVVAGGVPAKVIKILDDNKA